jgi:hypothetical protein
LITTYEVGAVFKVIDEATRNIRKILGEVKLQEAIDKVNAAFKIMGPNAEQVGKIGELATEWGKVATGMSTSADSMTAAAREGAVAAKSALETAEAAAATAASARAAKIRVARYRALLRHQANRLFRSCLMRHGPACGAYVGRTVR